MLSKMTYFLSLHLVIGLLAGKVTAAEADDVAELKKNLATQQALNQQLLRRLDALEAAQAAMSEKTKDAAKVSQLEKQLQAQEDLNQKLLDRLTAVEDAQAEVMARVEGVSPGGLDEGALAQEREEILEEILLRLDESDLRFDLLPTLGGYYDFEYLK